MLTHRTLVSVEELNAHLTDLDWAIFDCRFSLDDTQRGRRDYLVGHIPGAVYAHLNEDLSGPVVAGKTGRHPLPEVDSFSRKLSQWGIDDRVQVIVYDDSSGAMAARLWWMLRWLGHDDAAVLDGGWSRWRDRGLKVRSGTEGRLVRNFRPRLRPELIVTADAVLSHLNDPNWRIIDSRAAARFRGEQEPIDPVGGHIPGALNAPHEENVDSKGCFLSRDRLRARFQSVLTDRPVGSNPPPERTIFYCGSGVTAAHNLLAFAHAGLGEARLYAGSWSEWINDPTRPIAKH